jgi:hypothetical protein
MYTWILQTWIYTSICLIAQYKKKQKWYLQMIFQSQWFFTYDRCKEKKILIRFSIRTNKRTYIKKNTDYWRTIIVQLFTTETLWIVNYHKYPTYSTLCKQDKIYVLKSFTFNIEFCLFYTHHMTSQLFMKRICEHVAREDVRVIFLFQF